VHRPSHTMKTSIGDHGVLNGAIEVGYCWDFIILGSGVGDAFEVSYAAHYALRVSCYA
jgi:hypothetical protein